MARASSALLKRRLEIAEIVRTQGEVKVDELSEQLKVSNVTVRQDLSYLEQQGYLKRSFGGAIYVNPEISITNNLITSQNTLQNIGNARETDLILHCLNHLNDGDTLFLGHGCLNRKLIPFLYDRKSLILITNDLESAKLAKDFLDAEVILVGGTLCESSISQNNKILTFILSQYQISLFIFELKTISNEDELVIENLDLANSYRTIIKKAQKTIAIFPHQHNSTAKNSVGTLQEINTIILSNLVLAEYHQQLLDARFIQLNSTKYCTTYQLNMDD